MKLSSLSKIFIPPAALLLLAALIRLPGIAYGLPFLYRADELHHVSYAGQLARGIIKPEFFVYPYLLNYLLLGEYGVIYLLGHGLGYFPHPGSFQELYYTNPAWFVLPGRLTSLLFGLLTIAVLYRLAEKLYSRTTARLTALLAVFMPLHFIFSRVVKAEMLLCLATIIGMSHVYSVLKTGNWQAYLGAGFWGGLAAGAKYNGFFFVLPLILAHVFSGLQHGRGWRKILISPRLVISFLIMLAVFIPCSPFILGISPGIRWGLYFKNYLLRQSCFSSLLAARAAFPYNWHYLSVTTGVLPALLLIISFSWFIFKGRQREWLILFPALFSLILISFSRQPTFNYLLPWLLLSLILLARFLARLADRLRLPPAARVILLGVLLLPSALTIASRAIASLRTDTRTLAYRWAIKNIPPGTRIALENNIPPIKNRLQGGIPPCDRFVTVEIPNYYGSLYGGADWIGKTNEGTPTRKELREQGVEMVIVNSFNYDRYRQAPELFPRRLQFYRGLARQARLLKEIPAEPGRRFGPAIRFYRLAKHSARSH